MMRMREKQSKKIRQLVYSAVFLALALVLPFLTGSIPAVGKTLCPMHLPVLLCGFCCGPLWGLLVGAAAPILRMLVFGAPLLPSALPMMFELAAYGFLSGLLYRAFPKKVPYLYLSLFAAMLGGRLAGILGKVLFYFVGDVKSSLTLAAFYASYVTGAIGGIIVQILLVPLLVLAIRRAGFLLNE